MYLINCLKQVEETRSHINQSYPLLEVIFLVITAITCGQESWTDIKDFGEGNLEWLRQYLPYKNGIPTRHNIARIIRTIVPETLLGALVTWVNEHREQEGKTILAIDGKMVNGANKRRQDNPLSMVSAFDVEQGLVLYHQSCEGKGQEIEALKALIHCLDIAECIITADALHCQSETLQTIKDKGADALIQVKMNQPNLFTAVDTAFQAYWTQPASSQTYLKTANEGHGRQEVRTVYQIAVDLEGELKEKWPMIKSYVAVIRDRTVNNITSHEIAYFVSTAVLKLELAARATRKHWHTENQQHWVLDVVFREDKQTMYAGHSAENMAVFRRFVLNLLRCNQKKISMPRKMNKATFDCEYRHELLFA